MAYLLRNYWKTLKIFTSVRCSFDHQFRLINLRCYHRDIHKKKYALKRGFLKLETGSSLKGYHFSFPILYSLYLRLWQLDADIDRFMREYVRLEKMKIQAFVIWYEIKIVQSYTDVIFLRGILYEEIELWWLSTTVHQSLWVVAKYVCTLHALDHLLKSIFLSFAKIISKFDTVCLILFIFRWKLEVFFLVYSFEKLRNIVLYLLLFCSKCFFIISIFILFFIIFHN